MPKRGGHHIGDRTHLARRAPRLAPPVAALLIAVASRSSAQPAPSNYIPPSQPAPTSVPPPTGVATPAQRDAAVAALEPRAFLLDTRGELIALREVAFAGDRILCGDAAGRRLSVPLTDIDALVMSPLAVHALPVRPAAAAEVERGPSGALILVDGQRVPGRLLFDADKPDCFAWESSLVGRISAPLARLAEVRFDAAPTKDGRAPAAAAPPTRGADEPARLPTDELILTNGDRVVGFLASLGRNAAVTRGGDAPITIPADRVTRIVLANQRESAQGPLLWLSTGDVLRFRAVRERPAANGAAGEIEIDLPGGFRAQAPAASIVAITSSFDRLVPLSSLTPVDDRPLNDQWRPEEARATPPTTEPLFAAIDAADIQLPGARLIRWRLPAGACALVGAVGLPDRSREWGGAGFALWQLRRPLVRIALARDNAEVAVVTTLRGDDLTATLTPGQGGLAQTYAVLREPILIVAPRADAK